MFTRPEDLPDSVLAEVLHSGWGMTPGSLEYLAVGFGSHHWRANIGAEAWFVTVDDLGTRIRSAGDPFDDAYRQLRAALLTARAVYDGGAAFVVAPIPTIGGDVVRRLGDRYAVAVYPYVNGRLHAFAEPLAAAELSAVLEVIVALHATPEGARAGAPADDAHVPNRNELLEALGQPQSRWHSGPYGEPARLLLADRAAEVEGLLDHHDRLARQVLGGPDRMVLTHGEPHPGNLIETGQGWVLVDWDTVRIAPPERDLWLLEPADGSVVDAYQAATGRPVLPSALELYRLTWKLADIAISVAELRQPHGDTEDIRTSWRALRDTLS